MKEFDEKTEMLSILLNNVSNISGTFFPFAKCLKDSISSCRKTEKCFQKYPDTDKILNQFFTQADSYVKESESSFELCERLFHDSVVLYHDLIAYILAGRQGCKELQEAIEETTDNELLDIYRKSIQFLQERIKQLSTAEQFTEKFIISLKRIILKHYEFRHKQKHLMKVSISVFRHMYAQTLFYPSAC